MHDRSVAGSLVTGTFAYDGGRQAKEYVPPDPPGWIVVAADDQRIPQWSGVLEATDVPATMIAGIHGLTDETLRLHEYSPVFAPDRFAAHETFFVDDVRRWTASRLGVVLPAERTAVFNASAGGELDLALGLRHPDVLSAILCASPGAGYQPAAEVRGRIPRSFRVAGTQEPLILAQAIHWAGALRRAGAEVVMHERAGSLGGAFWEREFLHIGGAFGADRTPSPRAVGSR